MVFVWYLFLFLIDKAYRPYVCQSAFVVSVRFRTGHADSEMLGDLALRFYCSVLAAFRAGDELGSHCNTADTHKTQKRTHLAGLRMQNLPV